MYYNTLYSTFARLIILLILIAKRKLVELEKLKERI